MVPLATSEAGAQEQRGQGSLGAWRGGRGHGGSLAGLAGA